MFTSRHRVLLFYGFLGTLSLAFFGLDWALAPVFSIELLQVAIVLLTLFVDGRRSTLVFGGVTTLLVGAGYAAHLHEGNATTALMNHGIVLVGLWVAVGVVLAYKHLLQARRESEARARTVLDTTADGIFTIDADGTIESVNSSVETMFGYDAADLSGEPVTTLIDAADQGPLQASLRTYRQTGTSPVVGGEQELLGRRRDGTTFPVALSLREIDQSPRPLLTGLVRDIEARKRDERRLKTQHLTANILTDSDSLPDAAPRLLQTICEQLDWAWGELWMPTDDGSRLESAETWCAPSTARSAVEHRADPPPVEPGDGLPGTVWAAQEPKWFADVHEHEALDRGAVADAADVHAGFAFPIRLGSRIFGVMVFFSHDVREPDEGLLQMFSVIGNQIGQFTERRRTEEALQKTADRLSRAQEVASLGSWEHDFAANTTVWSDEMYRLFGVAPDTFELSLDAITTFFPREDQQRIEEALASIREGADSFRLEHRLEPRDGPERWMLTQAERTAEGSRLVGTTLDITELKETKQALEESEARAQAILDTTVDGIITIDADGIIESFNPAAEDIFGYDADEVVGKNVKGLMPSPHREQHDDYLRNYHETGRRNIIGVGREVTGRRKDGSTFPMDLAVSEVDLGDRTIFTGIVRDISERRRLEKEILNVSEQERRRIGQDLHDGLGQMLTGIGLLSQDVARQLEEEGHERADDMTEITEHIKEADQYARDLSHGLIPVDVESSDPSALPEALRRLSTNAERLFDVTCEFEEVETAHIQDNTTATHLYRIAQEAVNNAVRHGSADHIRVLLAAGTEQLRLQVRDDGTGFDTDDTTGADGMGVHIMNYRARIIGGSLDIHSELGEGTVVTCTVQRPTRTTAEPDAASPTLVE
jgi:PAS domain S-box-containing protein